MARHIELGIAGEDLARRELEHSGYRILEKNVRFALGEIDMVAVEDRELVIVEVRTRRIGKLAPPETSVGPRKLKRLIRLGRCYVERARWEGPWRVDVVAVKVGPGKEAEVEIFRDVTTGMVWL